MRRNSFGKLVFYFIFLVVPLALWIVGEGVQIDFSNRYAIFTTIAKIAGIAGVGFFAGNLILSGRYTFVDRLFGGLDRVYSFHRQTGKNAFYLLTIHYLLMTLREWQTSFADVIAFVSDYTNPALNYARIAYGGLFVLVIITLFVHFLKYEKLKFLHTFMGVFLFFGGLHVYLIPSDVAYNMPLRWYVLGFVAVALISWLVRTVAKRWLVQRIRAEVIAVNALHGNITEVVMKPTVPVRFIPGQFIFVRFLQKGFPNEEHPFSLTASTEEGILRISAKALGDFTKSLATLKPGAVAKIQGPFGGFSMLSHAKDQIWIAGGIGITPFVSMARTMRDRALDPELKDFSITLIHSIQKETDAVYHEELRAIASAVPQIRFVPWIAEKNGYLTADAIEKHASLNDKQILLCGPSGMMHSLKKQLVAKGVSKSKIDFELFKLL